MIPLLPIEHFDLFDKPKARILILYTGGTLGMDYNAKGELVPCGFENVLRRAPAAKELHLNLSILSYENPIDSSNVQVEHWQTMARQIDKYYDDYDGFVILHGTDTMAYSASALSFMLLDLTKPVIFTGAQLPIFSPRSDASENLVTTLEIASDKKDGRPIVTEVCIFFNNELLRGNRAKKVESQHFDAFESENYPVLAKAGITINYNHSALRSYKESVLEVYDEMSTSVVVLKLFPGLTKEVFESIMLSEHIKGIVIESYGSGNMPTHPWFIEIITKALKQNKLILNISQCMGGMVTPGKYETSGELKRLGVLNGKDLTSEAAVTKMMFVLSRLKSESRIKKSLITPIRGEMS